MFFSVRGPVPFLLCGGSWLGCAVVQVKGALFQSRSWLPIVEAPGYSKHPTSTLAMQLLNGKKRLQFLTQSYSILFNTVEPPLMATSPQRSPLHNSHLFTTVTSLQRSPLYNGHLSTMVTSLQRPPLYNGHLSTTVTSLQRSPLHNGHLSTTVTSLQRSPLYNGHLSTTVTSPQRPPLYNSHLSTTVTSLQWPPLYNSDLSTTASFFGGQSIHWLLFNPLYNGHFLLSPRWPLRREIRKCTYFWKLPGSRFKGSVAHTPWFMLVTWRHISKSKGHHMYTCRVSFLNFPHLLQRFINNAGTS